MTEPTTDRPTDTIRDAFDAMLYFLACLLRTMHARGTTTPAETIGSLAACEVNVDGYYEDTHAGLDALRDLVTRAAEEHNRRATAAGDFTPERIREARERCERATPGPWEASYAYNNGGMPTGDFKIPGHNGGATVEMLVDDAYFCAYAREDLPAALAWGEQQTARLVETLDECRESTNTISDLRAEIERLTAELAAETERRERNEQALIAERDEANEAWREATGAASPEELTAELAASAPADASLEARAKRSRDRVVVEKEEAQEDAARTRAVLIDVLDVDPWDFEDAADLTAAIRAVATASRPGLTEEQARALNAAADMLPWIDLCGGRDMAPDDCITMNYAREHMRHAFALLRASRGETGPAPTLGELALEEHRRAVEPEPFEDIGALPPNLGPGIGGAPIRVRPTTAPDPRATLHAGDPASLTARLASARAEQARLEERFRSYDGGDRAPSPPVSLMREERAAAQRVRDIEAEIAASKEQSQ